MKAFASYPSSPVVALDQTEFELDLCTDVVGVECPLAVGDEFSGIVTWNGEMCSVRVVLEVTQTRGLKSRPLLGWMALRTAKLVSGLRRKSTVPYSLTPRDFFLSSGAFLTNAPTRGAFRFLSCFLLGGENSRGYPTCHMSR